MLSTKSISSSIILALFLPRLATSAPIILPVNSDIDEAVDYNALLDGLSHNLPALWPTYSGNLTYIAQPPRIKGRQLVVPGLNISFSLPATELSYRKDCVDKENGTVAATLTSYTLVPSANNSLGNGLTRGHCTLLKSGVTDMAGASVNQEMGRVHYLGVNGINGTGMSASWIEQAIVLGKYFR